MFSLLKKIIGYFSNWFLYLALFHGDKVKYLRYRGARIGKGCSIFNSIFAFSEPWLIEIGDNVTLTSGVLLITHDGSSRLFRKEIAGMNPVFGNRFGTIRILDNCFIGVNTIILPDVTIGPCSIVGAGSVVTGNVPASTVYAGNPARYICSIEEYKIKYAQKMIEVNSTDRASLRKELSKYFWQEER